MDPYEIVATWTGYGLLALVGLLIGLVCLCGLLLGGFVLAGRLVQHRWGDGDADDEAGYPEEPAGLAVFTWEEAAPGVRRPPYGP